MMDKLSNINYMLHFLKHDKDYADISGYASDIEWLLAERKQLIEDLAHVTEMNAGFASENRQIHQQYLQVISKMKAYKKRNGEQKLALEQIKALAGAGKVLG